MRNRLTWSVALAAAAAALAGAVFAAPMSHDEALKALAQPAPATRLAGVQRLAEVGTMADAELVVPSLRDETPAVREQAATALWQIWSRSGDAEIDRLFARGVSLMQAAALDDALATFDEIIRRRPAFAEGWNKRATVYFLLGRYPESLKDVDEVLKRNRHHFGALSGAGQIHMRLGHLREAKEYFQRALDVNPNLEGLEEMIEILDQHLRRRKRNMI